jgi:hypothetical protein
VIVPAGSGPGEIVREQLLPPLVKLGQLPGGKAADLLFPLLLQLREFGGGEPRGQLPALLGHLVKLLAGELAVHCDHPLNEFDELTCGLVQLPSQQPQRIRSLAYRGRRSSRVSVPFKRRLAASGWL